MASDPRRVTLRDVADHSGVSYQTVSRVINNHPHVAEDTRARVLQSIEALHYRPNKTAKSLATSRSTTLGMVTYGMYHYGPAQMMLNTERAARNAGYDLMYANINDLEDIKHVIQEVGSWGVEGMLVISPVTAFDPAKIREWCVGTPVVFIDLPLGADAPSVVVDQASGTRLITQHLIDLGHRDICEITGPLTSYGAIARHESWRATLEDSGIPRGRSLEGDWTVRSGYTAVKRLLEDSESFTALVVSNDQMALGAIRALMDAGVRLPEDVSIVGYDDIPEAAYYCPPLTTIRQDFNAVGRLGIEYLMRCVANPQAPGEQQVIAPELVIRHSTAPPKK